MPFDPTASNTSLQPGQDISSDTSTLYSILNLSPTEGAAPVLLTRPTPHPAAAMGPGAEAQIRHSLPLAQTIQGFYNLPEASRSDLQKRLLSGGFYTSTNNLIGGQPDNDSVAAYANAARRSVLTGKTLDETIEEAAGSVDPSTVDKLLGPGGAAKKGAPATITLANPDDIRATAMKVSRDVLGQGFSAAQLDHFVQTFQGLQTAYAKSGTQAPSLTAAAEREARTVNPQAAGATDMASAYDLLTQAMSQLGGKG